MLSVTLIVGGAYGLRTWIGGEIDLFRVFLWSAGASPLIMGLYNLLDLELRPPRKSFSDMREFVIIFAGIVVTAPITFAFDKEHPLMGLLSFLVTAITYGLVRVIALAK